jgi:hypothetical protein
MLKPANRKKFQRLEIVSVGNEDLGYFYFAKLGYIKAGERDQLAEFEAARQESTFALDSLVSAICKDKGISRQEASDLVFGKKLEDGSEIAPLPISDLYAQYPAQTGKFLKQASSQKQKSIVATLFIKGYYSDTADGVKFIKGRSAKPVTLAKPAKMNDKKILIEPNFFYIHDGQEIKFGDVLVTVNGNYRIAEEDTPLPIDVSAIAQDLPAGEVGFLYSSLSQSYILGEENWSDSDTCEQDPQMIDLIFEFYQNEQSGWIKNLGETPDKTTSETPPTEIQPQLSPVLIGEKSTGESKDIELPILVSTAGKNS